jgi:hypothetical protein
MSAPRALKDSVRPRRLIGASGRPLNFTVRSPMVSARVQLRVVAALCALFGAAYLLWIATVWMMTSSSPPTSVMHEVAERYASAIPSVAAWATGSFVLASLSARLLTLSRSWQLATTAGSLLFTILIVQAAARVSAIDIPLYSGLGQGYSALAILLGLWWGLALVSSSCSHVLWRQVRASNNRWRGP